ncbi:hypothetical protein GMES_4618 [Paraglaciecola mesophila KMM 241]|uniref:Transposase n=1 Tax=Paraglaciecola mesophila KMM 241 TaxID=1128912 RepID=K6ZD56_9ALTE|nr:hypothetical protein [Paraglaciecola mesophila]GAC26883.1 hypothetical protein GMES_4618 [Paraglaciecola mesophila KMM 241]
MNNLNTIAIDLAKNVFQVGLFSPQHIMMSNKQFSRQTLTSFMAKQEKAIVVWKPVIQATIGLGYLWKWGMSCICSLLNS